jgi:hypothetical protein
MSRTAVIEHAAAPGQGLQVAAHSPAVASRPLSDIHGRRLSGVQSAFPILHECGNLYELDAGAHSVEAGHPFE